MNKKQLWERKLTQRNKKLTEAYDDNVTAKTADGKQVFVSASTRSTRAYNYEDVEFEFGARKGFGTYRWMNRPWQRFDFASALQKAMIDAGIDEKFARECIEKSGSLRSAVEFFVKNYNYKEEKLIKEEIEEGSFEFCVMDKYGNNIDCFQVEEDAIMFAKKNSNAHKVLLVKYGPEDEHKDKPELSAETIWIANDNEDDDKEYHIKYWLTEEDREEGFSDIFIDSFDNKQEAIMRARKMVDRDGVASVEVFDADDVTEQPVYFYDGVDEIDNEDINEEKELKEARGAGKGQKLDKYYRMVVNLYKDNLSKEEIERLKKAKSEVEKFEPKSEYEKRDKKNLLDQIARTLEDGTLKEALVAYDPAKWEPEDIELHKSIDWKKRNYEDFLVEGDTIETEVILYSLNKSPRTRMVTAQKYLRANAIYPPYYEAKEVPFEDEDEGGVVGGMFDGNKHNKTMIMDRYETVDLNHYLSI